MHGLGSIDNGLATTPRSEIKGRGATAIEPLPARHRRKFQWFVWYSKRYLRKHFNSFRVARGARPPTDSSRPLVIYLNHASWWDPLVCLALTAQTFPDRPAFAPMDAVQLERYRIFKNLGFFGVEQGSRAGAAQFLRIADTILSGPNILWITPQGRFCDVRQRPVELAGGISHLAARHPEACFVPLAIEYPFWHDRNPEVLVRWGEPVHWGQAEALKPKQAEACLVSALEKTQDLLAQDVVSQKPDRFDAVLWGDAGVGGIYDAFRKLKTWLQGGSFQARHDLPPSLTNSPRPNSHQLPTSS